MIVKRGFVGALASVVFILPACSFLVPFSEYDAELAASVDASDGGSDGGADGAPCSVDTRTDPKHCGGCGHDCRESTCFEGLCARQPIIPAQFPNPEMVIDDGYIYVGYGTVGGLIRYSKTNFNNNDVLGAGLENVSQMLLAGDDIFWAHPTSTKEMYEIGRTLKRPDAGIVTDFLWLPYHPSLIDADDTSLYFTDELGNLFTAGRNLTTPRQIAKGIFDATLVGDDFYVTAYFDTVFDSDRGTDRVNRMRKDGTGIVTLASSQDHPSTIRADATHLYWTNTGTSSSAVVRMPKEGGTLPETLYSVAEQAFLVTLAGDFVYYFTFAEQIGPQTRGRMWRIAKTGGAPIALTGEITFSSLALDATHLYWASSAGVIRTAN